MRIVPCSPSQACGRLGAACEALKSAPVEGEHELFGFLTTEPNSVVEAIHPKAMPVILTTTAEVDLWLSADTARALKLQ
jgi:putative SOS response-associated peptidase YedK